MALPLPLRYPQRRAPRVQLGEPVPAIVLQAGKKRSQGELQTVSVAGGLLRLAKALIAGDFVEIAFQTRSGPVHALAEMLNPIKKAEDGTLQAFRLVALGDESHRVLCNITDAASAQNSRRGHRAASDA
jgi:hypothetical protein